MAEAPDLSLWTGKPPVSSAPRSSSPQEVSSDSDLHEPDRSPPPSDVSSDGVGIAYDGSVMPTFNNTLEAQDSDSDGLREVLPRLQQGFYIDVPVMAKDEKLKYKHLPGHNSVDRILSEAKGGRFVVQLKDGDKQMVSSRRDTSQLSPPIITSIRCHTPPCHQRE